ncbi:MAG: mechanosensitive ion channel [Alistipes sp.]|nr:mechanosensitive ion channel [Alistipes sp.]
MTPEQTLEHITNPETIKESVDKLLNYDLTTLLNVVVEGAVSVALKIVAALAIYYVGRWIIRRMMRFLDRVYVRRDVDMSLRSFLSGIVKVILYIVVVLIIIQVLGINTTSIVAMLASAGLAVGMALSGTLQNFAGGVMILFLKPYRVGDYIDAQGEEGTVSKIGLFSTEIRTVDNRVIYIPNSTISTSVIDNYSMGEMRRVDWTVSAEYGTDATKLREVLMTLLRADSRIVEEPAPVVYVTELTEGSVKFSARGWVRNADYWDVKFDMNERIYNELGKQGIKFANPQLDVTIKNN